MSDASLMMLCMLHWKMHKDLFEQLRSIVASNVDDFDERQRALRILNLLELSTRPAG